jgi:hypothetical protein
MLIYFKYLIEICFKLINKEIVNKQQLDKLNSKYLNNKLYKLIYINKDIIQEETSSTLLLTSIKIFIKPYYFIFNNNTYNTHNNNNLNDSLLNNSFINYEKLIKKYKLNKNSFKNKQYFTIDDIFVKLFGYITKSICKQLNNQQVNKIHYFFIHIIHYILL